MDHIQENTIEKESSINQSTEETDEKKKDIKSVSLWSLFRYANWIDFILILISILAATANGVTFPLLIIVFGNVVNTFTDRSFELCSLNFTDISLRYCPSGIQLTPNNFYTLSSSCNLTDLNITMSINFTDQIQQQSLYIVAIGCCIILIGYLQISFSSIAAERQTRIIRQKLFRSIVNKEIIYFDINKPGQLNTRLTDDINKIHDGIGDKLASATQFIASFIAGFALGFAKGWKLTLVILSISPLLFVSAALLSKLTTSLTSMELKAYGKAGAIAEEALSSIRIIFSYNGQEREKKRYKQYLNEAKSRGIKKGAANGMTMGVVWLILYCSYALGYWYGAKLIRDGEYDIGRVMIVFVVIIVSVFNLGQASPHLQALAQARTAASFVWNIIDTTSKIDSSSNEGIKKTDLIGNIKFVNVKFSYSSRSDIEILKNLSFNVKQGETIALVGSSGSGKSTCIQLLQRFYDLNSGSILIDENPINKYNLKWLRQHIGVVSQEPILFQTTIRENILFGFDQATDEQIHQAAKMANAHQFIMKLPQQYDTLIGERGATLSGGQKQRIAIARALIRNPKILLLDEATSALDNESEKIVQDALDRASQNRTTIVIAHRLSTIRNADKIIVMQQGEIIEQGNHETLMNNQSIYYNLIQQQNLRDTQEKTTPIPQQNQQRKMSIVSLESVKDNPNKILDEEIKIKKNVSLEMLKLNKPEWIFIFFGCIACICNGTIQPTLGIVLSKLTAVFQECDEDLQDRKIFLYNLLFIAFGIISLIATSFQSLFFACSGEALTKRLRIKTFEALLHQDISYFDDPNNNTGALCTRLSTEASAVQGATGIRLGLILQNFSSLAAGLIIGFIYSWELTLLIIAFIPFIIAGGFLESRLITGFASKDRKALENAGKIAVETIQNIRTVAQLTKEDYFYEEYSKVLEIPYRSSIKRAHVFGFFYALTASVIFFAMAALFSVGAHLVNQNKISFEDVLLIMNCIIFSAQSVGQTASLTPDYNKGIDAGQNILDLLNRKCLIDNGSNNSEKITNFRGELEFNGIHFTYPTRSEVKVLKNFNLKIKSGQRVALVGTSGCGKSTIIQLMQRFYDVNEGQLLIDSKDIRNLNLQWYRSQIGIVFQEPVLFDMSIRENIAYGDNSRDNIPIEEIIQAAKNANIHQFIQQLPQGYETNCGAKGTQLSGGQKQRIAIARALLRNPKILLLDEATSALDSESEKIVQDALDEAQLNRTSITIAHRLSTIQNSDLIYVLHDGKIVEFGNHQELLQLQGRYYRLALQKLK